MPVRTPYIDIDKTLVDDEGNPYEGAAERLIKSFAPKYPLTFWSHTGGKYAMEMANILGLYDLAWKCPHCGQPAGFLDKPDVIIDDRPDSILRLPAILQVNGPDFWTQSFSDMFKDSRGWFQRWLQSEMAKEGK